MLSNLKKIVSDLPGATNLEIMQALDRVLGTQENGYDNGRNRTRLDRLIAEARRRHLIHV